MKVYGNPGFGRESKVTQPEYIPKPPKKTNRLRAQSVSVDGIVYGSYTEAARATGLFASSIRSAALRNTPLHGHVIRIENGKQDNKTVESVDKSV